MDKKRELKPIEKQYFELKAKYSEAILLFRCGDFYEAMYKDAKKVAEILGITLKKDRTADKEYCSFPRHALDTYLPKLVRAGHRVAICDQLEMPKKSQEMKRGITELVVPTKS